MADPFTNVTISNYNANPPSDDGAETSNNEIKWSNHKTKLGDPLKTAIESLVTNVGSAVDKLASGVITTATNYGASASVQGKLVVATASSITITTPDATTVGEPFVFFILNKSSGDITVDGNGSQTIDGLSSLTVRSGGGLMVQTDGTNWFTSGRNYDRTQIVPQGYLTPTSGTPVITSDVSAATAVYYTPDTGYLTPVSDGSNVTVQEFSELTLTLNANHTASTIYDVFLFLDSGTLTIGTGPAWNNSAAGSGARGSGAGTTELTQLKGLYVNANAMTARNGASTYSVAAQAGVYVGSIFIDSTAGQITCHVSYGQSRKWSVWNAFNKKDIILNGGDLTASWNYITATTRPSNNNVNNNVRAFCGLPEERIACGFLQRRLMTGGSSASSKAIIGIGVDSTVNISGTQNVQAAGASSATYTVEATGEARHDIASLLGLSVITALETAIVTGSPTTTFYGTESYMRLWARWRG